MRHTPLQILTMRRLIPVILPVVVIMIAYSLQSLWEGASRLAGGRSRVVLAGRVVVAGLLLYLALYFVNASVPIFGLAEGGNQFALNGDIASSVDEGGTVVMDYHLGDLYGPPLRCFYGVENAWLMDDSYLDSEDFRGLLGDLGFPEKPVYLLWRPSMSGDDVPILDGLRIETTGVFYWREKALESSFTERPDERVEFLEEVDLFRIEEQGAGGEL